MKPEEIGQRIKQMYPQYKDVEDSILGQKYILKYGDKGLTALGVESKSKQEEPRSGTDAKVVAAARSGIKSAESARKEIFGTGKKATLGGHLKTLGATTEGLLGFLGIDVTPWGRGLEKDLFNMADAILRIRTGAAAPEKEIQRYVKKFGPRVTDSSAVKLKKINEMQAELEDVLSEMGESSTSRFKIEKVE